MKRPQRALAQLLLRGAMPAIVKRLELRGAAGTAAPQNPKPGHPAVTEAVRMVPRSSGVNTEQARASLSG